MTPFRFITLLSVIVSLFLLFAVNTYAALQLDDQPIPPRVIINNPVVPDISEQFLREVFSGKMRHWPDGKLIKVIVLKADSPLHQAFIQQRLRMFPYQVQRLWNKRIYSGRADPPIVVNDINAMRTTVVNTPGAIGYLPSVASAEKNAPIQTYAGGWNHPSHLSAER